MDPALIIPLSSRCRSSRIDDMAHMVFKKPLQNQETRENYIKQRQELRKEKELGFIDAKTYEEAKKNLIPETASFNGLPDRAPSIAASIAGSRLSGSTSSSDGSTAHLTHLSHGKRKGSILDRNNVARLVYRPDAQSEGDREALRLERAAKKALAEAERFARLKAYQYQLNEADEDNSLDPSRFDQLTISPDLLSIPTDTPALAKSTSNSSMSIRSTKSQFKSFNFFRKRSASTSSSPPPLPVLNPPPLPFPGASLTVRERRPDSISTEGSTITRRHTESRGGGREAILDAIPMTFADIFLMGPPPDFKSRSARRRHSFSSQNSRPSTTHSRQSNEAPAELVIRKAREAFVFESRPPSPEVLQPPPNTPLENSQLQQPPLSTDLEYFFLSLIEDFEDTSILFSYPKYGRVRRVSYSSSLRSIPRFTRVDEEMEESGISGEGGGETFFIDDSTTVLKATLEKQAWFLMAMKWLSFGRVLFSPGHHLIELSGSVGLGMGVPNPSILDLDGAATADLSWHLAKEYPFAIIYNILLPHSSRPPRNSTAPPNIRLITTPSLTNLSALPSDSIDVMVSHNLPRLLLLQGKNRTEKELIQLLTAIFRECARVLKPSGYFEMTIVDPVMNNMGPRTRTWATKHIALVNSMRPSKMILAALEHLSGEEGGRLFDEVKECWVWMPTTSIGDELSTVTSMVGRHLYDHLYAPSGEEDSVQEVEGVYGISRKRECKIWKDEKVTEECQKENTAFRWLKCYARKV